MRTRRNFIRSSAAFTAGLLSLQRRARADELTSGNGLLDASLEAAESWVVVGERSAKLYTYNGQAQAPRLIANAGDTVRLRLTNLLGENTNLHYHGLHIPPSGSADDVFVSVEPGESRTYEFQIPTAHPGGLFWYHPHVHGNTARQVARGLAGLFVIRGELDSIPEIAAMPEHFLVLQDFRLDASGYISEPGMMERIQGREGQFVTVSGEIDPAIEIAAGGWVRLRLLNASASRYYRISIEQHTMWQLASDGGALPSPEPVTEFLLVPGGRADVAVQGERGAGAYRILSLAYDRHNGGMMGGMMGGGSASAQLTLATLSYAGQATQVALPDQLVGAGALPSPALPIRQITLGQGMRMAFTINGRSFDHGRIDFRAAIGTVQDWEFVNTTGMDHPMHVHTNPFQVVSASGDVVRAWRDTVNVPANSRVRVRTRFSDFTGLTVLHCHILDHEDLGMMATLQLD